MTNKPPNIPQLTPQDIFADPSASRWLQDALRAALHRDPVDAANDAEVLAGILDRCMRRCLEAASDEDAGARAK
jgi:hypothetical protein